MIDWESILTQTFGQVLAVIIPILITAVIVQLIRILQAQVNKTKLGSKLQVDDIIFNALQVGVTNVGNTLKQKLLEASADGKITEEEKVMLRETAIKEAGNILSPELKDELKKKSGEEIATLIRYIVDAQKKS